MPVSNSSGSNGNGVMNHSLLGSVYDENGCVPTAGYSWCNHTQRSGRQPLIYRLGMSLIWPLREGERLQEEPAEEEEQEED